MSYSSDIGLDLFMTPFREAKTPVGGTVSGKGEVRPRQEETVDSQQETPVFPAKKQEPPTTEKVSKQAETLETAQQTEMLEKPKETTEAVPIEEQHTEVEDSVKQQPDAEVTVPQETPKKELSLDMSDHSHLVGKTQDVSEDVRRKAHEEAEAKRKAEWDEKQLAKKQKEDVAIQKLLSMSDTDIVSASKERIRTDVERITRRNMKECVSDHIQSVCQKNTAFARRTMYPKKSMAHCFQYINRKAKEFIQKEMEENDIQADAGGYGSDVPDRIVYQWAEDYFNDMDAQEDKEKEEKFVSRPYIGTASKAKKTVKSKKEGKTVEKESGKRQQSESGYQQMSLPGVN